MINATNNNIAFMYIFLTIILSFIFLQNGYSSDVKFYNIGNIHGTSKRDAFSVCKDKNGFIWASTQTGIIRYTESNYRTYQLPCKTYDFLIVNLIYKNSKLFSYTNNGQVFIYDEILDRFYNYFDLRDLLKSKHVAVKNIVIDDSGYLYIATSLGLYVYKNRTLHSIFKDTEIDYITFYDGNRLFCATKKSIQIVNTKSEQSVVIHECDKNNTLNVSHLYFDSTLKRLWIGTFSKGLIYYDITQKSLLPINIKDFPRQPILAIEKNTDNTLFVGIDGQGIWNIDDKGQTVLNIYKEDLNDPYSLKGDGVYDIFCDSLKTWVATFTGGLSFFEKESPTINRITYHTNKNNSLGNKYVNQIFEDRNGNIWFATNNGLSQWVVKTNKWNHYYQNTQEQAQVFLSLADDDKGNIWAGTYSTGVYIIDYKTGLEIEHHYSNSQNSLLNADFVIDLFKDSDMDMWIGGNQDLICYSLSDKTFRKYPIQTVTSLSELEQGKLLVTTPYGLLMLTKKNGDIQILIDGCLAQDVFVNDSIIWVATAGAGLIKYNYIDRTINKITTESGLSSNYVNSIAHSNGYLWIGTETSLCRLNTSDNTITNYSSDYYLFNTLFNVNASSKLYNGNIAFGTNNGVIIFNPDSITQTPITGDIFIQDISIAGLSIREKNDFIMNTPINKLTDIYLPYNQNTLSLDLVRIGLSSASSKLSWFLDGFDKNWTKPSEHSIITYTNLPSGKFKLKIRLFNSSVSHIIEERVLNLQVIPPFWRTWWFYSLAIILTLGVIYYSFKLYVNKINQQHAEDKIRFFTNIAHDIRTSLTLINAPLEELNKENEFSEKSRSFLNIATEQSLRLSYVASQLLDFQKIDIHKSQLFLIVTDIVKLTYQRILMFEAYAKKKNIRLIFRPNTNSFNVVVDEIKIEKIIDNLLSNAIKYSFADSKIEITLNNDSKVWTLEVRDYGLGISNKERKKLFSEFYRGENAVNAKVVGSGIGLLLVKNYVNLHGGKILITSKENNGSLFKIVFPHKDVTQFTLKTKETTTQISKTEIKEQTTIDDNIKNAEKKKYLLIVEDNDDLQDFLKYSFQDQYIILTADDGLSAWRLILKKMPDLIISDIMMPNMDGFELCKLVKSTFETSHIPLILLTALSEKTKQMEGLGLGADDYITKPFDISLLSLRITTIIKNREIVREKALKIIKQDDSDESILKNELNDVFLKKALKTVHENIANNKFGKDEFAAAMHVSPSLLYKKIKSLTNQSPSDFIKTVRLNYALELLQSQKYTVTEISESCGFSSIYYFSRAFKVYFGKAPSEIV